MKTDLHIKLNKMVRKQRLDPKHWWTADAATVYVRDIRQTVTLKRALFALFIGPIPEDRDVRPVCGEKLCISPYHSQLFETRNQARALDLSWQAEQQAKDGRRRVVAPVLEVWPAGKELTPEKIHNIRQMSKRYDLRYVSGHYGIALSEVVAICNGRYDKLVARETAIREKRQRASVHSMAEAIRQSPVEVDHASFVPQHVAEQKEAPPVDRIDWRSSQAGPATTIDKALEELPQWPSAPVLREFLAEVKAAAPEVEELPIKDVLHADEEVDEEELWLAQLRGQR